MAESDLIRGNVDTIILKVLYEGDRYGYDLIKQINARSDGQWEIKQPTVYACLKRLEKQGFITSYWDSSESDGGRRKYYSLTESGREVFLKYKSEFERASSLFGGLISGGEPTVFIQPTDDYSDVEEEGYSLPKRKVKRTPKKPAEDKQEQKAENAPEVAAETQQQPVLPEQPVEPATDEPEKKTAAQTLFELAEQQQAPKPETTVPKQEQQPAREALDPKLIIEQLFAAERGESYSDTQRKNTFASADPAPERKVAPQPDKAEQKPVAPAPAPVQPAQPAPAPAPAAPVQSTASPASDELPAFNPDRPMLVPAAIPGFESAPAPVPQKQTSPAVGFATEEESPARREYKTVLEELVDRFE
ncbi:MAG: helix-turn-helix transcriptional regulator, partial [Clostridiales bacterium]|nr:helix-turn-helix transcriptional regulator [Clostridiales bacterium]